MRRAWLLALLIVPALAAGQASPSTGQVTFDNDFINSTECNGTGDIALSWTVALDTITAVPATGSAQVFATNQDFSGPDCPAAGTPTGRVIGPVGDPISQASVTVTGKLFPASLFVSAAGLSCTSDAQIFVCVQLLDAPGGNKAGWARGGPLKLSLAKPLTQTGVSALGGDRALHVSWTDPNSPQVTKYEIVARSILDPANVSSTSLADPRDPGPHSDIVTSTGDNRLGGLVNDVVYSVVVYAFSAADNMSDPSLVVTGSPHEVNDFWDTYSADGGRERGGCSTGTAGALGLLVAGSLLAALRRRK